MYNFILENIVFPAADALLKTNFISELKYWRYTVNNMDASQLKSLQRERLQHVLQHTAANIPFYKKQHIQLTGDPYRDIKSFPVLHKKIIKQHIDEMYLGDKGKMVVEKSSGSSGIQGEVYMTQKENLAYQAVQTYLWEWGGYRLGEPLLQTGITLNRSGIKGYKDKALRTIYVGAFNLSEAEVVANLTRAKQAGCTYFAGYASSLNVYATIAMKAGIDIQFKGVISWGDKFFDTYKNNVAKAFGNPTIAEVYGTTEGFMVAGLCEAGNYHQLSPQVYLELLDKDGNEVAPGEIGYVVVTRLDVFSFPLVRYYLGDLAIREKEDVQCSCGRHFPLLRKIVGRDTDVVTTPKGKQLIVHFFTYVFEHEPTIHQFRVIQKTVGAIDIEYIPTAGFQKSDLERVAATIHKKAEEVFPVNFIEVNNIPATASGKPQIILNTLARKMNEVEGWQK